MKLDEIQIQIIKFQKEQSSYKFYDIFCVIVMMRRNESRKSSLALLWIAGLT